MSKPMAGDELLLGIDIGTTSVKATLVTLAGAVCAEAAQEYPTAFPRPNWAEQDPEDWWRATCAVLQQVCAAAGDPARVAALSVSCQGPSLLPMDAAGRPLSSAQIWMDRRSTRECESLRGTVGDALFAGINGGRIDPYYMAPKLYWLRKHEPDVYARAYTFLQANGYIVHKLCRVFTLDRSIAPLTLLYDARTEEWSDVLIEACGADRTKLPPLYDSGEIVGRVTPEAAAVTGLATGTPVLAGLCDGPAAALEAGLLEAGDAAEMTGQSTVLLICSDRPYLDDRLIPLGHPLPDRHVTAGAQVASGGALRWFRDELGEPERRQAEATGDDAYALLSLLAQSSPPGANSLLFLPYLYGERSPIWDSDARGVFFGLSLSTHKADMVRAVMEGAAYGLRHNVEAAEEAGFPLRELVTVGGGAKSLLWNQIKADVLQRPVRVPDVTGGAVIGDAMLAAASVGLYPTLTDAVTGMMGPSRVFQPRPELAQRYDALYTLYVSLYPRLREAFRELALTNF
ncbi:MAG: FGGY-family carbohydrate kinase [Caldilineaceae bacterium]|nr:FGGY-family carbohydrate kinase [Caldilineaceae bacterium]